LTPSQQKHSASGSAKPNSLNSIQLAHKKRALPQGSARAEPILLEKAYFPFFGVFSSFFPFFFMRISFR
jgi:hypothetical protein